MSIPVDSDGTPIWLIFFRTGMYRIIIIVFLYIAGFGLIVPYVPEIMTNFYASQKASEELHCKGGKEEPPSCQDAHGRVVEWAAGASLVTNVLVFFVSPMIGYYSDRWGRKVFILLANLLATAPKLLIWLHFHYGTSLALYYPLSALNGVVSIISIVFAMTADLLPGSRRAAGFGVVVAAFFGGITFTPWLGQKLGPKLAIDLGVGIKLLLIPLSVFFLQETLPRSARNAATGCVVAEAEDERNVCSQEAGMEEPLLQPSKPAARAAPRASAGGCGMALNPLCASMLSLRLLLRSSTLIRLTVCVMISSLVNEGLMDSLLQYLQMQLSFTAKDNSYLFMVSGLTGCATQLFLLELARRTLGIRLSLVLAFLSTAAKDAGLAFATTRLQVYALVVLGSLSSLTFPAVGSVVSLEVADWEQGSIQGALSGAQALAQAVGPVLFAQAFHFFTSSSSPIYFPGGYLLIAAGLMLSAALLSASLDLHAVDGGRAAPKPAPASPRPCPDAPQVAVDASLQCDDGGTQPLPPQLPPLQRPAAPASASGPPSARGPQPPAGYVGRSGSNAWTDF